RPADAAAQDASRQAAEVMTFAMIGPGDRVLDLGAYTGFSSWIISGIVGPEGSVAAQNPPEWTSNGTDISDAMTALTTARTNATSVTEPFDRLRGGGGSYDGVVSGLVS